MHTSGDGVLFTCFYTNLLGVFKIFFPSAFPSGPLKLFSLLFFIIVVLKFYLQYIYVLFQALQCILVF